MKKRIPKTIESITQEQIEQFAAGSDVAPPVETPLNPLAKRDYKAICVPFNQYEYNELEKLCIKTGRSRLSLVRYAILKMAKKHK